MKNFKVLTAILALAVSTLACQTVMGGNGNTENYQAPPATSESGEIATMPPVSTEGGNVTVGGESPFPMTADASNIVSTPEMVTYTTKLSADEIIKFYQEKFSALGYTEEKDLTVNFGGIFSMTFDGHESGKKIVIAGVPFEGNATSVTIALQ